MVGYTTDMETLPQDYYKPVSEMKDKELWMSTLTEDSRPKSFGDNKICLIVWVPVLLQTQPLQGTLWCHVYTSEDGVEVQTIDTTR